MTRTPLLRSKGQRSRSPGRFTHRGVNESGSCSGERGNVLTVGTYGYVAVCRRGRLGGARHFCAHRGRRGRGHIVAVARLQLDRFVFVFATVFLIYSSKIIIFVETSFIVVKSI